MAQTVEKYETVVKMVEVKESKLSGITLNLSLEEAQVLRTVIGCFCLDYTSIMRHLFNVLTACTETMVITTEDIKRLITKEQNGYTRIHPELEKIILGKMA